MEITEAASFPVEIPPESPVSFCPRTLTFRDHAITYVRTADGSEGVGYSPGCEGTDLVSPAVESLLEPMLVGEDPPTRSDRGRRRTTETYESDGRACCCGLSRRSTSHFEI